MLFLGLVMDTLRLAFDSPVVVLDTETGGLSPQAEIRWEENKAKGGVIGTILSPPSPILQISAIRLNQQTLEEEAHFNTLIGPDDGETVDDLLSRCTETALKVNGIGEGKKELSSSPSLKKVITDFMCWLPKR